MDDGTLEGSRSEFLQYLEVLNLEGHDLGLQLNNQKSQIISSDDSSIAAILSILEGARTVDPSNDNLLGSPIGNIDSISVILRGTMEFWDSWVIDGNSYLHKMPLSLLRLSLAIHKLLYTHKTSPHFLSPS